MPDPSFVLDLRPLVRQGIVRGGAWVREGRIVFRDPSSGRAWGATGFALDTRRAGEMRLVLRYDVVRSGERVELVVTLRAGPAATGWRFVCPLGCRRTAVRLHLPAGASRFGCRSCHRALLRRSDGPPAIRPPFGARSP